MKKRQLIYRRIQNRSGQTIVLLISFIAIALVIITVSTTNNILLSEGTVRVQEGSAALDIAETGAENALLRLIRNSSYTGETFTVGSGSAAVAVSGSNVKTIIATGTAGIYKRTVQVVASNSAGIITVQSWQEL